MSMREYAEIILKLRSLGWDDKRINDFLIWSATDEEKYRPSEM